MNEGLYNEGEITITGSAVAVGSNAYATNAQGNAAPAPATEAELRAELGRLVERLRTVANELADRDTVVTAADEVTEELASPTPRWRRILAALRSAAPGVAALTQLATDTGHLATAVEALLPH